MLQINLMQKAQTKIVRFFSFNIFLLVNKTPAKITRLRSNHKIETEEPTSKNIYIQSVNMFSSL